MYLFRCIICISISLACSAFQVFFKRIGPVTFYANVYAFLQVLLSLIELVGIHI